MVPSKSNTCACVPPWEVAPLNSPRSTTSPEGATATSTPRLSTVFEHPFSSSVIANSHEPLSDILARNVFLSLPLTDKSPKYSCPPYVHDEVCVLAIPVIKAPPSGSTAIAWALIPSYDSSGSLKAWFAVAFWTQSQFPSESILATNERP